MQNGIFSFILVIVMFLSMTESKTLPSSDSSESDYGFYELYGVKVNEKDFLPIWFGIPPTGKENTETTTSQSLTIQKTPMQVQGCTDLCGTLTTSQYDPVCGTDNETYQNEERIICVRERCKVDVQIARVGACQPQTTAVFQSITSDIS